MLHPHPIRTLICRARLVILLTTALAATTAAPAAAGPETAAELPILLRLPIAGPYGPRVALASPAGSLLHGPDLVDARVYTRHQDRILPLPAKAENGLWGYLDANGAWLGKPRFLDARSFTEDGLARVQDKGGWGFVDATATAVVPPRHEAVDAMSHGLAAFRKEGKWGYLNTHGEVAIAPRFSAANRFDAQGLAVVKLKDKAGVIDGQGKTVVPFDYELIGSFAANGLARASRHEKWGYVDRQGRLAIPLRYSLAGDFGPAPVAAVESDDQWGVIDAQGAWVVKPRYHRIADFSASGLAAVWDKNYNIGYLDVRGKELIAPRPDIDERASAGLIRSGGKGDATISYLDTRGKEAIAGPFDWGSHFQDNGLAVARRNGEWGVLRRDGRFRVPSGKGEPMPVEQSLGFDRESGLVRWISGDGSIVWLNGDAVVAFRLTETAAGKRSAFALSDGKGQVLWQSGPQNGHLANRRFLDPTADDLVADSAAWRDAASAARSLLKAKPRRFLAPRIWENERDPYEMPDDLEDVQDEIQQGAILVVAHDYVSEEDWGAYYYLDDQRRQRFKEIYQRLRSQLLQAFGKLAESPELPAYGDASTQTVWTVGKQRLILEWNTAYGDGDITHQLLLMALAPG